MGNPKKHRVSVATLQQFRFSNHFKEEQRGVYQQCCTDRFQIGNGKFYDTCMWVEGEGACPGRTTGFANWPFLSVRRVVGGRLVLGR